MKILNSCKLILISTLIAGKVHFPLWKLWLEYLVLQRNNFVSKQEKGEYSQADMANWCSEQIFYSEVN